MINSHRANVDQPDELTPEGIGLRVREFRSQRKLTARQLADGADVTPSFISQVERGLVMPSIPTLIRIAAALNVRMTRLLEPAPRPTRFIRLADRRPYHDGDHHFFEAIVSSDDTNLLEVVWSRVEAGGGTGDELYTHGSQAECAYVLVGQVEIRVGGESYHMDVGDCLTIPGGTPHGCFNHTSEPAELLWMHSPANY